jgi:hypothetical protein
MLDLQLYDRNIVLDERQVSTAVCALEGDALQWAVNCRSEGEFVNYNTFCTLFLAHFESKNIAQISATQLSKLKYQSGKVETLYREFSRYVDRIPGMRTNQHWIRQAFVNILPEALQNHVNGPLYLDLLTEQLIPVIKEYELQNQVQCQAIQQNLQTGGTTHRSQQYTSQPRSNSKPSSSNSKPNLHTPKPTSATQPKQEQQIPDALFQERIKKGLCGKCGESGHSTRQCTNGC